MLSLLATLFSQHARLLEIKTALPEAGLMVERFSGREAVSETFRFEIDCISTNAYVDLGSLLGKVNNESTRSSENLSLRNKAYYHLKEAVDKLRKAGQYAFWQDKERLKGYSSAFIRNKNLKSRKVVTL